MSILDSNKKTKYPDFMWGKIVQIHTCGRYDIVEYKITSDRITKFHPYVDNQDTNMGFPTLDTALIAAIAYANDNKNSTAIRYIARMLDLPF